MFEIFVLKNLGLKKLGLKELEWPQKYFLKWRHQDL